MGNELPILRDEPTLAHLQGSGGVSGGPDVVSDQQDASAVADVLAEVAQYRLGVVLIQIARGFVGQDDFGTI